MQEILRQDPVYDLGKTHAADEILVQFADGADPVEIAWLKAELGAETLGATSVLGIERLSLPEGSDIAAVLDRLADSPLVALADAHYQISANAFAEPVVPNDPNFGIQWALENTGDIASFGDPGFENFLESIAEPDADIDATEAWAHTTGEDVVVAIIDTGIDLDHPDLATNLWVNPGEIAGNGIDDDNNGYIDDIHGFDFGGAQLNVRNDRDNDPTDIQGHGTHVAGIVAADGDNGISTTGVAPDAQVMALRIGSDDSDLLSGFAILEAIEYAVANGARVSNNSYGPIGAFARPVIEAAGEAGHLFVAAAGNDSQDQDAISASQRIWDLDNVISVAASSLDDTLASFSNFGATTVDLAAPGHFILSSALGSGARFLSGTSMAAPHVAGAAALAWALDPTLTVEEVKEAILSTVDPIAALDGLVETGGRLNVANLVESLLPEQSADPIVATDGADTLTGTSGEDEISGLQGDDLLQGLGGADTLNGNRGNDTLDGGAGTDLLAGGFGDDLYLVDQAGDTVEELADRGIDTVESQVSLTLAANVENLTLVGQAALSGTGNALANEIMGNAASNELFGAQGSDFLRGGDGNDLLRGGVGNDTLNGGSGADEMRGWEGNDRFIVDNAGDITLEFAGNGKDTVVHLIDWTLADHVENLTAGSSAGAVDGTGNSLANEISGNSAANVLRGLAGADTLNGRDGNDRLEGGAGADSLTGGAGADDFVLTAEGPALRDTITDFGDGADRVLLDGLTLASLTDASGGALARFDTGHEVQFQGLASNEIDPLSDFLMI
ncbi:MAG: S8 family serine peptidase [Pseudomonadota bacterium]